MNEQVPTGMPLLYLVMYIAFFAGVMYLLVFRPQKKKNKRNGRISKSEIKSQQLAEYTVDCKY